MGKRLIKEDVVSRPVFLKHFTRNLCLGFIAAVIIILIGITGFRYFEKNDWVDAYANSAMIVSGVGLIDNPKTEAGKLFAATFSVVGGGSFLLIIAVVFSPIFHWLFRQVHVEDRDHFKES